MECREIVLVLICKEILYQQVCFPPSAHPKGSQSSPVKLLPRLRQLILLDSAGGDKVPETLPAVVSSTRRCHVFFISWLLSMCFETLFISLLLYIWSSRCTPLPPASYHRWQRPACFTGRWRFSGVSPLRYFCLPEEAMPYLHCKSHSFWLSSPYLSFPVIKLRKPLIWHPQPSLLPWGVSPSPNPHGWATHANLSLYPLLSFFHHTNYSFPNLDTSFEILRWELKHSLPPPPGVNSFAWSPNSYVGPALGNVLFRWPSAPSLVRPFHCSRALIVRKLLLLSLLFPPSQATQMYFFSWNIWGPLPSLSLLGFQKS